MQTSNPEQSGLDPSPLQLRLARSILEHGLELLAAHESKLSEAALAQRLGVSRTPIRAALIYLSKSGLIKPLAGRGYKLESNATVIRSALSTMARSDEDVLTERLLADRASGRLAEEVSETELIQQYGVPRGVIRRVLMRLASEGVTERATGHGWRFAAVLSDRRALQESYRFRLLIETSVFGQPEFRLPAREVIRLRLVQEDLAARASSVTHAEYFETNRMFHDRLAAAGNNRFLYQAVRQQLNLRRLLEFAWPQPITAEVIARQCHEHIAILAALEANDRPAAARFMQSHLADAIGAQS